MKNITSIGMFAAIAFAVGMTGISLSDGTILLHDSTPSANVDGAAIQGHIEVIHTDADGNVKTYIQTDNSIMNDGRNCTAMLLFGQNDGCNAATAANMGKFTVIGITNSSTTLPDSTAQSTLPTEPQTDGLARKAGTLGTFTEATATFGATATQRISATFTYTDTASNTIGAAGLFNDTVIDTASAFALKKFPSNVTMAQNDQLTVNWDISISGTDAIQ